MIEDNNVEPGEPETEELRRRFVNVEGLLTPRVVSPFEDTEKMLTPRVVNADNALLGAYGGFINHVPEVAGEQATEVPEFVPTRHELSVIVTHWMTEVLYDEFLWFSCAEVCMLSSRRAEFGRRRIERIVALIGVDAVKRAIDEAIAIFGQKDESEAMRIFLRGTKDEQRVFCEKRDAESEAMEREYEDQLYASILKFLAGEPHDLQQGTVEMAWAERARTLVTQNPALAAPENKAMLLKQIQDHDLG